MMAMTEVGLLRDLDAAWDDFIHNLNEARSAMKDPQCFPPPQGDRNNAEGYRYVLGHLHRLIETEVQQNADFPYIQHHPGLVGKYTIDNADCSYLYAPIKPDVMYRLTGRAADFSHWKGARNTLAQHCAPNYVILEAHTVAPGDSGGVQELFDGSRVITDRLDSREMVVDDDGSFEVLIGPACPEGYVGNVIATIARKGSSLPRGDVAKDEMHACRLYIRELFGDWEKEVPLEDLYIERVDFQGKYPSPRNAKDTAAQMRQLGRLVRNHMRYWTTMYGELLNPFQQASERKPSYLLVNELFSPRANTTEGGGGQSTNIMTGGIFRLTEDQALVVEFDVSTEPEHIGFHLGNYWGESYDFANHVTSLNHLQSHRDGDGVYRYVVSSHDPGIQNWLDTTGHPSGYLTVRFTCSTTPPKTKFPKVSTRLLHIEQVREVLPQGTPVFSARDRVQQIRIRQRHVARRYRQY